MIGQSVAGERPKLFARGLSSISDTGAPGALMISLAMMVGFRRIVADKPAKSMRPFQSAKRKIMSNLAQKECVPCKGGMPPLKGADLERLARELAGGWRVE